MAVPPAVLRRLMRELNELRTNPPDGIRVVVNEDNMLDVTGIVEGPDGTPYAGGYFRVRFNFTEEFPAAPPKCWFATKIFHPNVSSAGEICVNTLKKDWKSSYGIGHILVTVKCLLIYPNPESALDEEAGKLLLEDYQSYCDRAKLITSVHATPKVRPAEFNTPSRSAPPPDPTTSTSASMSPAPSTPTPPPAPPSKPPSKSTSAPSLSAPLHPSGENTFTTSPSASSFSPEKSVSTAKERHVSPSPLATADANVAPRVPAAGSGAKSEAAAAGAPTGTKAVKRAAVASGATGEKRKKALKRL
ncbi:ubiquitin-conjugating enzyme/RWD-like protein [Epithele typhae]|uniref:ubiquitin-conjugating enzyme/RWD-like protein n=1 Tax=Epithele typhae TaxID=378194 RepID=UPI0020077E40|nr:ubiquitin-conjugating enzyme/RWD-like protein [Epithele typhae]KAH9925614.1 ubiquitin-conjugating enzyme/RWD-like protein [Epithele typhae]